MDLANEVVFENIKGWVNKQVNRIAQQQVGKKTYNVSEGQIWTTSICQKVLKTLTANNKNFKYIVNSIVMQKADCGMNVSGSCYWDNEMDGNVSIKLEFPTLICIVNVFACGL